MLSAWLILYEQLQNKFYDSIDQRKFCIVTNKNLLGCIRHVIRVSDDADEHLEEFKHEYYTDYTAIPGDEFYFMIGYHNVNAYLAEYREFKENGLSLWIVSKTERSI